MDFQVATGFCRQCAWSNSPLLRDNVPLAVYMLPATGSHNLIHVEGDMTTKTEIGIDPKVTAYGVSAEVGYWKREATKTAKSFITFSLTATTNENQAEWTWHKTEQSDNCDDPDLGYSFGFQFAFAEHVDKTALGAETADDGDMLAVEIDLCDFSVTFEQEHWFKPAKKQCITGAPLCTFRSDKCQVQLEDASWPIGRVAHAHCASCNTRSAVSSVAAAAHG
jgi:hypothetical protein